MMNIRLRDPGRPETGNLGSLQGPKPSADRAIFIGVVLWIASIIACRYYLVGQNEGIRTVFLTCAVVALISLMILSVITLVLAIISRVFSIPWLEADK
jgi:cation transporter-like permease